MPEFTSQCSTGLSHRKLNCIMLSFLSEPHPIPESTTHCYENLPTCGEARRPLSSPLIWRNDFGQSPLAYATLPWSVAYHGMDHFGGWLCGWSWFSTGHIKIVSPSMSPPALTHRINSSLSLNSSSSLATVALLPSFVSGAYFAIFHRSSKQTLVA